MIAREVIEAMAFLVKGLILLDIDINDDIIVYRYRSQ
jgi:hypothetical protein